MEPLPLITEPASAVASAEVGAAGVKAVGVYVAGAPKPALVSCEVVPLERREAEPMLGFLNWGSTGRLKNEEEGLRNSLLSLFAWL